VQWRALVNMITNLSVPMHIEQLSDYKFLKKEPAAWS
jgi:hypothetical protein